MNSGSPTPSARESTSGSADADHPRPLEFFEANVSLDGRREGRMVAKRIRCVIVDDNDRFTDAVRRVLEHQGVMVVGAAENGTQARRLVADLRPDVTLVDFDLGGENGFDLIIEIVRARLSARTVMILCSAYARDDVAALVELDGQVPFLSKADLSADAIRAVVHRARDAPCQPPLHQDDER